MDHLLGNMCTKVSHAIPHRHGERAEVEAHSAAGRFHVCPTMHIDETSIQTLLTLCGGCRHSSVRLSVACLAVLGYMSRCLSVACLLVLCDLR
jgi:hypothetical protein